MQEGSQVPLKENPVNRILFFEYGIQVSSGEFLAFNPRIDAHRHGKSETGAFNHWGRQRRQLETPCTDHHLALIPYQKQPSTTRVTNSRRLPTAGRGLLPSITLNPPKRWRVNGRSPRLFNLYTSFEGHINTWGVRHVAALERATPLPTMMSTNYVIVSSIAQTMFTSSCMS